MRFGRALPALSVLIAAGALIVLTGSGAAAPTRSAPQAGAASPAGITTMDAYLRAIGARQAPLVMQRGARNYAGPNCPGVSWNCTTSKRVLQIATDHGKNKVECTPTGPNTTLTRSVGDESPQSCVIVQTGDNNKAKCHLRSNSSTAVQHCSITQTGKNNDADIHQTVHADDNDTEQTATQTASVTQTQNAEGSNKSHVKQDVKQKAKDGTEQSQDAQQSATVNQMAMGAGSNDSKVDQDQDMSASAKGAFVTQHQNTDHLDVPDCDPSGVPLEPNACANINQTSGNGDNKSHIKQSIKEDARTRGDALQQQGSGAGGLEGRVHQETGPDGRSTSKADQNKRQTLRAAPGSMQDQFDPVRCCGVFSQLGGTGNSEKIDQDATQDASEEFAFQKLDLFGESSSPTGSCSISQRAKTNEDSAKNDFSLDECPLLLLTTSCTGTGDPPDEEEVFFFVQDEHEPGPEPETCTEFSPVVEDND